MEAFTGNRRFLSNFYVHEPFTWLGREWTSVEVPFQMAKTLRPDQRAISDETYATWSRKTPAESKRVRIGLREDWESVKISVMLDLLERKFAIQRLAKLLAMTGDDRLVETNWWGDTFWGVCDGVGQNHLGNLLEKIRKESASNISTPDVV